MVNGLAFLFDVMRSINRRQFWLTNVIAFGVAGAWYVWSLSPERPLQTIRVAVVGNNYVHIAPDGKSMTYARQNDETKQEHVTSIVLIPELRDIAPPMLKHRYDNFLSHRYLADGSRVAVSDSTGSWLIGIPSGEILWHIEMPKVHWEFSNDSKIAAAFTDNKVIVFETARQNGEPTLAQAILNTQFSRSYRFNNDSRLLATCDLTTNGRVLVWDTLSGKKRAQFDDPQFSSLYHVEISPDNSMVGVEGTYQSGNQTFRGAAIWDISNGSKTMLPLQSLEREEYKGMLFASWGRCLTYYEKRWDLTVNPPMALPDAGSEVSDVWYDVPEANRYFKYVEPDTEDGQHRWTLFAADSHRLISSGVGFWPRYVSTDHKWAVFVQEPNRSHGTLMSTVLGWLPIEWPSAQGWTDIIHLESGRRTARIPLGALNPNFPTKDRLWTTESSYNEAQQRDELILREWSCYAAGPPWWLWVLTVIGLVGTIREFWAWRFGLVTRAPNASAT